MRWTVIPVAVAVMIGGVVAHAAGFSLPGPAKNRLPVFRRQGRRRLDPGPSRESAAEDRKKALDMKIPFVENVPEVAGKITPAAETFIKRGFNVIIGTAFGYSDTFKELSQKYPKVAFPQRLGHDQWAEPRIVLRTHLREPISLRHGGGGDVQVRQARVLWRRIRSVPSTGPSMPMSLARSR